MIIIARGSRIKGITISLDADTTSLGNALKDVNKRSRDLSSELREVENALKFNPGNVELLAQKQRILTEQVENTTDKLNRLKNAQAQVEAQFKSGDIGQSEYEAFRREIIKTESQLDGFKKQLASIDDVKSLDNLGKDFKKVTKDAEKAKEEIKNVGSELTNLVAGAVAGGGIAGAVSQALDTSSLNTKIEISMEVPPESIKSVKEAVNTVSAYGVDAESALEGVRRQWALNADASDEANAKIVKGAATIAAAYEGIDFTELIQEVNEIAGELNISNEEALALTNSLLKVGFPPEEIDIIAEYGQQLTRAGYSAEEIQAIMAAGVDTGTWNIDNLLDGLKEGRIRLAEFGEEVPKATTDLLEKTNISAEQMREWGQAVAKGGEEGRSAMQQVAQALNEVEDETIKNALGTEIFGTMWEDQGQNIIDTLLGIDENLMSTQENQELLNQATEQLSSDPAVQMREAIGELKLALEPLFTTISSIISKIAEWVQNNPQLVATITAIVTALGILMGIFLALSPIITSIAAAAGALGVSMGAVAAPVLIVIGVITALIAIGVALWQNWETISAKATEIFENVKQTISNAFQATKDFIVDVWNNIQTFFTDTWNSIKDTAITTFNSVKDGIETAFNAVKDAITTVWNSIKDFLSELWNGIKSVATTVFNAIKDAISTVFETVRNLITNIWNGINNFLSGLWNGIKNTASTIFNGIKDAIITAFNFVRDGISTIWNGIVSIVTGLWNGMKDTATSIFNSIKDGIIGAFNGVKDKVTGIWDSIWGAIKGVINKIIDGMNAMIGGINKISFDVPDWVPGIGGKKFGFDIPTIPRLAKGGVVSEPTLAMVGDAGLGNPEIVAPQKMLRQIIREVMQEVGGGQGIVQNITIVSPEPTSPSENARKFKQAQRQLAMEW